MSTQNHYASQKIDCGQREGVAFWAVNPSGRALIFVHGFMGDATGTWEQFPSLLQEESNCAGVDLIFYSYDTLETAIGNSGALLRQFLNQLATHPLSVCNPTLDIEAARNDGFQYKELTIVAHSLGAVVSRLALVGAYRDQNDWLQKTRLVLFAPAHCGARAAPLLLSALTWFKWLGPVGNLALYRFPVLEELKEGSLILKQLLKDTEDEKTQPGGDCLLASQVFYGSDERVVYVVRFSDDPEHISLPGKDHTSVCKPDATYKIPVAEVVRHL